MSNSGLERPPESEIEGCGHPPGVDGAVAGGRGLRAGREAHSHRVRCGPVGETHRSALRRSIGMETRGPRLDRGQPRHPCRDHPKRLDIDPAEQLNLLAGLAVRARCAPPRSAITLSAPPQPRPTMPAYRSPTTGAVPNPSSPRPPRASRSPRRRCTRALGPRWLGSPTMGGQCEKSSFARAETNREIRYETTCDATAWLQERCSSALQPEASGSLRWRARSPCRASGRLWSRPCRTRTAYS